MIGSADLPPVGIVGTGAVGTALARRLVECGGRVEAVLSRQSTDAQALADQVGAPAAGSLTEGVPTSVRFVFLCVPDEVIESVADTLAIFDHPWGETIAAHTSGTHTAALLAPLAEQGALPLSFHPLQTFTTNTSPAAFEDIVIGLEGNAQALRVGERLAQALGARPIRLTPRDKVRYHSAAALASNGLVALMSVVQELFSTIEIEALTALDVVGPLVEQTLANLKEEPVENALTGPVARGDVETVEAHLDALADSAPHIVSLYVALSTEMTRIATRGDRLNSEQVEALLDTLRLAEQASSNGTDSPTPLH